MTDAIITGPGLRRATPEEAARFCGDGVDKQLEK